MNGFSLGNPPEHLISRLELGPSVEQKGCPSTPTILIVYTETGTEMIYTVTDNTKKMSSNLEDSCLLPFYKSIISHRLREHPHLDELSM